MLIEIEALEYSTETDSYMRVTGKKDDINIFFNFLNASVGYGTLDYESIHKYARGEVNVMNTGSNSRIVDNTSFHFIIRNKVINTIKNFSETMNWKIIIPEE